MNGFSDIISILKHNNMFHKESIGLVVGSDNLNSRYKELKNFLQQYELVVLGRRYMSNKFDYIVILEGQVSTRTILMALHDIANMGVIIIEITGRDNKYEDRYRGVSAINNIHATKVFYEDRVYLVLHPEGEYGN